MQMSKLFPLFMVPALAMMGCAAESEEPADAERSDLTASASFTAAVGAVEVNGKQICTGTLVDVEAGASLAGVSLSGRQVVLGGACIGRFSDDYAGGAVFVSTAAGVKVRTPIAAINANACSGSNFSERAATTGTP